MNDELKKISNFKTFSKISAEASAVKVGEENEIKRSYIVDKVREVLSKMDISSLGDLTEDQKEEFVNNLFTEDEIEIKVDGEYEIDVDKDKDDEEEVSEAEVKSDDDFKDFAEATLKKAFGDDYDEEKAKEVIDGIIKKNKGDYGAMVGTLQSSVGK